MLNLLLEPFDLAALTGMQLRFDAQDFHPQLHARLADMQIVGALHQHLILAADERTRVERRIEVNIPP
jgi:hypothetical protein